MKRFHRFDIIIAWYGEFISVSNYRPRTVKDYCFELSYFRRWTEKHTPLDDIDDLTGQHLQHYSTWLYDKQLSPTTVHHKLSALTNFFTTLYEHNKLYTDLSRHIHLPRIPKRLPADILTEQEIQKVFTWLEDRANAIGEIRFYEALHLRNHAVFEVLYSTGMRRSEVLGAQLTDIRYDDGLIYIEGKGGKNRVAPIGGVSLQAVKRYVRHARHILAKPDSEYLFVSRRGSKMSNQTIRQIVMDVTRSAGITRHVKVHSIRHSCATHMLNSGADIRYVQELLGHADLSSTQVYTHVSIEKLKQTHAKYHPREKGELCDGE